MDAAQVRDRLLVEILDGGPESRHVFDEYQTVRRLGVTRAVLREALTSLTEAGLLRRAPRVGTSLVSELHYWSVEHSRVDNVSQTVRFETVGMERVDPEDRMALELSPDSSRVVTRIERVTVIDGRASEHWTIWTSMELSEELMRTGLPSDLNWYKFVGTHTGQTELQMSRRVIHCRATQGDRTRLDVEIGDPLRFTSRRLCLPDGTPIDIGWGRTNAQLIVPSETFTIRV